MTAPYEFMTMPAPGIFSDSPDPEEALDPESLGLALLATCQMVQRLGDQLGIARREMATALAEIAACLLLCDDNN